ncbi:hypothetical protein DEI93_03270 [Curtobacterium sp. MCBD17_035]|uniref:hypothetical protein n=1 Tax=Curtobacterium sp. MCBD17_035 TaxID=2175673 RepID=UPI000DA82D7B|nr:hypothetical protein [Curtobacterium sp. MCBD17_035]WIB68078.1 hypothetical protein DEI93_03270 [Curtobacterium sp. MCBD17_035]
MTITVPGEDNARFAALLAAASPKQAVAGRTVTLDESSRIITRQQLTDPDFYAKVRLGVLDGSVTVLDQQLDSVRIGGTVYPLTSEDALMALANSEASWIGREDDNPFLSSLMRGKRA